MKKKYQNRAASLFLFSLIYILSPSQASAIVELNEVSCSKYPASVERVTDGDTLVVDIYLGFSVTLEDVKIRMYGINTPESRTKNLEEKSAGIAAKKRLTGLLARANRIELCVDKNKPRGKFGRVIAIVFADGININQAMIDEGHAVPYFGGKREPWAPRSGSGFWEKLGPALKGLGYVS